MLFRFDAVGSTRAPIFETRYTVIVTVYTKMKSLLARGSNNVSERD